VRQTLNGLALVAMDLRRAIDVPGDRARTRQCRIVARFVQGRPEQVCVNGESRAREPVFAEPILIVQFDRGNLSELRSLVAASADHVGLDARRIEDLLVVASELASNAVRHAGGSGVLRLWLGGGALHCSVTDQGPGLRDPDRAGARLVPITSDEGRGLWLARRLSDGLSVVVGERGTSATATFSLP